MKSAQKAKVMLFAVVLMLGVMAAGSMKAADTSTIHKAEVAKIHTAIYNQFSTSNHMRGW